MFLKFLTAALLLASSAAPALSQETDHGNMHHGSVESGASAATSPSSKAFAEANAKMHKDMDIVFSGNTDVDFVRGMIAHHQGGNRHGQGRTPTRQG